MEVRDQDKKVPMPSSFVYNPPISDSSGPGSPICNPPQSLHHLHSQSRDPLPDPDPVLSPQPIVGARPPPPPDDDTLNIRYRECLKNHAASMGGHVVDGCGEFMPGGEEGTPEALRCAACDCHRNFHRKEINGEPRSNPNRCYTVNYNPNNNNNSNRRNIAILPLQLQHHKYSHGFSTQPPITVAFGGGGAAAESSSEDLNVQQQQFSVSKKRFRTKFSVEQKERMMELATKLEWKIQKQDEEEVQKLCAEVGVKRQVFKVWMHNNKQAMKKRLQL